jgi:maltooligosyltrehalose synthase
VIAFAREQGEHTVISLVSRISATTGVANVPFIESGFWQGTFLYVPRSLLGLSMTDCLRAPGKGEQSPAATMTPDLSGRLPLDHALAALPVALLEV